MLLKIVGAALALLTAFSAAQTYEHDLRSKIFERKLNVIDQVLSQAGDVTISEEEPEFGNKLDHFGVLKHGALRMLGEQKIYAAALTFYNTGAGIYNKGQEGDDCSRDELSQQFEHLSFVAATELHSEFPDLTGVPMPDSQIFSDCNGP